MSLSKSKVIRQFDRAAAVYDRFANLQVRMGEELIEEIKPFTGDMKTSVKIADLGCGTGSLLESLVDEGYLQLSGYDIAPSMLLQAAQKCPEYVALACCDIESLEVPDCSFDVIVSNAAIQWCESARAFEEIKRILKPQGRAFIKTFGPKTLHQWREAFGPQGDERIHSLESSDQLAASISNAGLCCLKIESQNVDVEFDSVTAMFDSVRKIGATNATTHSRNAISKSKYQTIRSKFQQTIDAGQSLKLTYEVISITAQRK